MQESKTSTKKSTWEFVKSLFKKTLFPEPPESHKYIEPKFFDLRRCHRWTLTGTGVDAFLVHSVELPNVWLDGNGDRGFGNLYVTMLETIGDSNFKLINDWMANGRVERDFELKFFRNDGTVFETWKIKATPVLAESSTLTYSDNAPVTTKLTLKVNSMTFELADPAHSQ